MCTIKDLITFTGLKDFYSIDYKDDIGFNLRKNVQRN